ncbi:MAG: methyltransferase RsmF C-terminal domain-like protein [Arcticibacter sp.]
MLPDPFVRRMQEQLGDAFDAFLEALAKPAPVSVRTNPYKPHELFTSCEKVAWSDYGRYLPERISFTMDPLFHAGCYYVQEASSMYLELAFKTCVEQTGPLKVLDLCAAPGGKSTHLLSLLPEGSLLVSNEVVPNRNAVLRENLSKWGKGNVVVIQNEAKDIGALTGFFDVILVDAPCSGEGLFRKNPEATQEWSEDALTMCSQRQSDILDAVLPALKENGILIYSTCTFNPGENDEVLNSLFSKGDFECMRLPIDGGVVSTRFGVQMYPHSVKGEGFYMAALKKLTPQSSSTAHAHKGSKMKSVVVKNIEKWLEHPLDFELEQVNDMLYALPKTHLNDIRILQNQLYVRKAGVCLGSLSADVLQPSHELALFVGRSAQISCVQLEREVALRYLRGEAISTSQKVGGWHLAAFEGEPLGWMKGAGLRYNNNYPKELRIRNL